MWRHRQLTSRPTSSTTSCCRKRCTSWAPVRGPRGRPGVAKGRGRVSRMGSSAAAVPLDEHGNHWGGGSAALRAHVAARRAVEPPECGRTRGSRVHHRPRCRRAVGARAVGAGRVAVAHEPRRCDEPWRRGTERTEPADAPSRHRAGRTGSLRVRRRCCASVGACEVRAEVPLLIHDDPQRNAARAVHPDRRLAVTDPHDLADHAHHRPSREAHRAGERGVDRNR